MYRWSDVAQQGVPPKLMDMRGDRTEPCGMGRRTGMYTEYVSFASVGFISKALGCSCVPMMSLGAPLTLFGFKIANASINFGPL